MNLNKLHRIFKHHDLTREDVKNYSSASNKEKRLTEEKSLSDDFNADAMEGWESIGYNTDVLNNLDSKFKSKPHIPYTLIGVLSVCVVISIIYFTQNNSIKENTPKEVIAQNEPTVTIEQTDIVSPEIEVMQEAEVTLQKTAPEIIEDFTEKKNNPEIIKVDIENLPPLELTEIDELTPIPLTTRFYAKEIYLHNFKLVDYREYRSASKVKAKQLILTGTSANLEGKEDEVIEENEWKDIEVPYHDYIDKSIRIFERGENKRALARFDNILATYKNDINANFYGGLCLFNLQEYHKAISYFNTCLKGEYNNFDEEAQWLTALCYSRTGDTAKARAIFKTIVNQNGFYAKQAQEKLNE